MNHDKEQNWNIAHLVIFIFSDELVKMYFILICLDRYMYNVVIGNRYLLRGSKENVVSITNSGNVNMFE